MIFRTKVKLLHKMSLELENHCWCSRILVSNVAIDSAHCD